VEVLGADQQGLESVVEQLIDEQKTYEARLQALEAIILHGHTVAPVPAGYLNPGTPASSAAATEQLASLPIEPEVNTRPMMKRASPEKTRVSSIVGPAEQNRPVKEQAPSRPQPAGTSGSWVINLGSYSRKKVADRMLAEFLQQDVAAEQIKVVVNDATMYRVRVAGFDTRQAAMQHTQYLQEQLGIADIWITGN
jgi:cell division protein FtsN